MAPIDQMKLLDCFKVMVNDDTGGFKGPEEALQSSKLMEKYSSKIVSKTLYIFILKESTPHLLDIFMDAGGWSLVYNWLKNAVEIDHVALLQDLLKIFHILPVTMERLRAHAGPKLVKKLSKTHIDQEVKTLAQQLVKIWLKVVQTKRIDSMMSEKENLIKQETSEHIKSDTEVLHAIESEPKIDSGASLEEISENISDTKTKIDKKKCKIGKKKVGLKKGKINTNVKVKDDNEKLRDKTKIKKEKIKEKVKDSSDDAKEKKKEKINTNVKVKDDNEELRDKTKIKKQKIKEKVKDDSDDAKEKKKRIKGKNDNPLLRKTGELTDDKPDEDKQTDNNSPTLPKNTNRRKQNLKNISSGEKFMKAKLLNESKKYKRDSNSGAGSKKGTRPLPLPASKSEPPVSKTILEKKNYSIHVEQKKYVGEKKPTVKTFNSKFRSSGLEEQPPPPPKSKVQSKKLTKNLKPSSLPKVEKRNLSPSSDSPNEKKLKTSLSDSKKLPSNIQESGLFMDAVLNVINSSPKVNKKRKPKVENIKKNQVSPLATPLSTYHISSNPEISSPPRSPVLSPSTLDLDSLTAPHPNNDDLLSFSKTILTTDYALLPENSTDYVIPDPEIMTKEEPIIEKPPQLNFYRETLLDTTTESLSTDEKDENIDDNTVADDTTKISDVHNKDGLRSVLVYVRNKSSNKSVTWRQENDLVEVSYFEHDETERVNVTKNFKAMEMHKRDVERQNFMAVRKLNANDKMEPKIPWQYLDDRFLIDIPVEPDEEIIEPRSGSQEKKKQTLRERSVVPTLYFSSSMVPDSPAEPDHMEIVSYSEPLNIPLEDMSEYPTPIYIYNVWPEPKGEQLSIPNFSLGMNNMMSILYMMMLLQPQFPGYGNNQMNWCMAPENMMGMDPLTNNIFIPPNQIMMNNQMYMGDQIPQQSQPLPLQQQSIQQQHHQVPVQEHQWMGPPIPSMQHDQHWSQHQPPNNNGPPTHFERGGGCGRRHTRWDNPRGGNYDSYRGKINRNNQQGNRGWPYNRRGGHPGNGRAGRLCKYYLKGFCKKSNCSFLHTN